MRPTGGAVEDHDHEFDEVAWLPAEEALKLMTYDTDRAVVEEALGQLAGRGRSPASAQRRDRGERATAALRRHAAARAARRARRADGPVRRLGDADPVRLDPGRAPHRPQRGRPVRPVAHGRGPGHRSGGARLRPLRGGQRSRRAGARTGAVLDALRRGRRDHRRPDRLPHRRRLPDRLQRVQPRRGGRAPGVARARAATSTRRSRIAPTRRRCSRRRARAPPSCWPG